MKHRRYLMNWGRGKREEGEGEGGGRGRLPWCPAMPATVAHLVTWGKAADAQGEQDPAASMRGLGGVLRELLADLAVDLITQLLTQDAIANDEVQLLKVGGRALQNGHLVLTRLSCVVSHHICYILEA